MTLTRFLNLSLEMYASTFSASTWPLGTIPLYASSEASTLWIAARDSDASLKPSLDYEVGDSVEGEGLTDWTAVPYSISFFANSASEPKMACSSSCSSPAISAFDSSPSVLWTRWIFELA